MSPVSPKNPFAYGVPGRPDVQAIDADSRIRMVPVFSVEECNAALELTGLQKTVRQVVLKRLRKLTSTNLANAKKGAAA